MESKTKPRAKHLGRKISRMREILGVKQDTVADELGVSQQTVPKIEQAEEVDDETLGKIAGVLGIKPEAIRNFDEEATMNFIQNNYEGANQQSTAVQVNYPNSCTFNPLDKLVEMVEENKKLYEELLKSEREKVAMLERLLQGKN